MENSELKKYIKEAREKKFSDESIRISLLKAGWGEKDVESAISKKEDAISMPPPPIPQFGMWIGFQYVLLFITLYIWATAFGGVLHNVVDQWIPDLLDQASTYTLNNNATLLKWYMASLVVAFPIFALLFVSAKRHLKEKPLIKNLRIRKQLIYITMVGTFIIMLCHVLYTVYSFLDGKTTANSLAHLGVTLLVAGSIFAYLLQEVREDRKSTW